MCCRSNGECIYSRCHCQCLRCKRCDKCHAGQKAKQVNPMTLLAVSLATKGRTRKLSRSMSTPSAGDGASTSPQGACPMSPVFPSAPETASQDAPSPMSPVWNADPKLPWQQDASKKDSKKGFTKTNSGLGPVWGKKAK